VDDRAVAVVTGANSGIGRAIAVHLASKGYRVFGTVRRIASAEKLLAMAAAAGTEVELVELDVADDTSVRAGIADVIDQAGRVDVLVNNAAALLHEGTGALQTPVAAYTDSLDTNVLGPLRLCQTFVPGMRERGYGRVVNVSSGAGQLAGMGGYAPAYSLSKAALNALTRLVAHAGGPRVLVNSVDPGWVRTDMGGASAPRSVEEGADTIVWLATLPDGGPTGGFFHDRRPVAW
jgi:NAD(P)-dependent dehydrogenase (short-subunit alcohol dehydrogenase family)